MADTRTVETINPPQYGYDYHVGTAAELLAMRGDGMAAALLLDVKDLGLTTIENAWLVWEMEWWNNVTTDYIETAVLQVDPASMDRFTDEIRERVLGALNEALILDGRRVERLIVAPAPADEGWRQRLEKRLGHGPTNQARLRPIPEHCPKEDGLYFRSAAELDVYRALKRALANREQGESIAIAPNAAIRVRETTWEIDFLVTFKGRAGVIEVDGPYHRGRRAPDRDRERILEDSGVYFVERITVEDTNEPNKLDAIVWRFLQRLGSA